MERDRIIVLVMVIVEAVIMILLFFFVVIVFDQKEVLAHSDSLNFSVIYTDTSLLSLDRNNQVSFLFFY